MCLGSRFEVANQIEYFEDLTIDVESIYEIPKAFEQIQ